MRWSVCLVLRFRISEYTSGFVVPHMGETEHYFLERRAMHVNKADLWYVSTEDRVATVEKTTLSGLGQMAAGGFDIDEKGVEVFSVEEEAREHADRFNRLKEGQRLLEGLSPEDLAEVVNAISPENISNTIERLNVYT